MRAQVETTIEVIRPALQADGGDIILHAVNEDTGIVEVELTDAGARYGDRERPGAQSARLTCTRLGI